jgi:hypothetical protein
MRLGSELEDSGGQGMSLSGITHVGRNPWKPCPGRQNTAWEAPWSEEDKRIPWSVETDREEHGEWNDSDESHDEFQKGSGCSGISAVMWRRPVWQAGQAPRSTPVRSSNRSWVVWGGSSGVGAGAPRSRRQSARSFCLARLARNPK